LFNKNQRQLIHATPFLFILLPLLPWFNKPGIGILNNFRIQSVNNQIDPVYMNSSLLEKTLIKYTNQARKKHRLENCKALFRLQKAARAHSQEMASLNYFSHESPTLENRTLKNRIANSGISLINIMIGENIGVDYFLKIANVPFYKKMRNRKVVYINAKTERVIQNQTYQEFAKTMVDNWMKSIHHRENILNKTFTRIGIGVAKGMYNNMAAIYVTQHFMGPLKP